jgi:hypothetical protein
MVMSETIKELAKKAYDSMIETTPSFLVTREIFEQKFAEMLINESIEVMKANDYHGEWLGEKLKEHFGIE